MNRCATARIGVAFYLLSCCAPGSPSGTGGSATTNVGSGGAGEGGAGGSAGSDVMTCPSSAPAAYSQCDFDSLVCTYAAACPVIFECVTPTSDPNTFGWRPRPPQDGDGC